METKNISPDFPGRLKVAREALGKNQKELSAIIHVSARAWQGYEDGSNIPGSAVIEPLSKIGFNANWFLTGKGPMWREDYRFHDFISNWRIINDWNIDNLALMIGVPSYVLMRWETGDDVPDEFAVQSLSVALKLPVSLLSNLLKRDSDSSNNVRTRPKTFDLSNDFVFINQVNGNISAGAGLEADNSIDVRMAFRRDYIKRKGRPDNMSLIKVSGDSMEPTLLDGDLVLVNHSRTTIAPQGGIYALAIDNEIMIKRVQLLLPERILRIISDNRQYEPMEIEPDQIRINGKVIWFARDLER